MSLSAITASIASQTQQTVALASSLQQSQNVIGLLEAGQANLEAVAPQGPPPTPLDGTGSVVNRTA